ncbi:MAG: DNA photolyase [Candidatus Riflebacteria bacterium]|nr:DNA photolyase [Candidatus Riflebacteria bacterium]
MKNFDTIFLSKGVEKYPLTESIISQTPHSKVEFVQGESHPGNGLLLTENRGTFFKPCPGMKGNVCCGLWVVEWGLGCPFKCEYCILQFYQKCGDITLFLNWEDCEKEIRKIASDDKKIRICTGEFGDSLALEKVFPFNRNLISRTQDLKNLFIEVKTKSTEIDLLLDLEGRRENIIFAFSVNGEKNIAEFETGTAPLNERIKAAARAANMGFKTAFHFDPIIPTDNWEQEYFETIRLMAARIPKELIAWISLGTFRFPQGFQGKVENIFPNSKIFREEFYPCSDGKLRYFRPFREKIYKVMINFLKKFFPGVLVYLCMESPDIWERATSCAMNSTNLKTFLDGTLPPNFQME